MPEGGCPLAALGSELWRHPDANRRAAFKAFGETAEILGKLCGRHDTVILAMHDIESGTYFRHLAVRCLTASRDCYELRAKEEFRKLAEEFAAKADELERVRYPSPPKPDVATAKATNRC